MGFAIGLALWIGLIAVATAEQILSRGLPRRAGWRGNSNLPLAGIMGFGVGMTCLSTGLDAWRTAGDPIGAIVGGAGVMLVLAGFVIWIEALVAAVQAQRASRA
jgi:hypothetical protein